mmetsp:Transcript_22881/g.63643  ORF Transcript_22881/g.63643 Transcript_22881/m.63643 type:complete len:746 (+) Transcript_22881:95-2332(+)
MITMARLNGVWTLLWMTLPGLGGAMDGSSSRSINPHQKKCSIFIAPSSLKNSAGYGVYSTRDIDQGQAILSGPPQTPDGPSLPVINPDATLENDPELQLVSNHWNQVFGHYWWGRGVPDHTSYEAESVMDFQITFGALPNHHCVLSSLDYESPKEDAYDDTLANRYKDPGAGAFSYHKGRIFAATQPVKAGQELFLSYGYCDREEELRQQEYLQWQQQRQQSPRLEVTKMVEPPQLWHPQWATNIPMQVDFDAAEWAVMQQWKKNNSASNGNALLDYDDIDHPRIVKERLTSHARAFLPKTWEELQRIMQQVEEESATILKLQNANVGTSKEQQYEDSISIRIKSDVLQRRLAREYGTTARTPEWIEQNGLCIEHLVPGPSTLPQAGQGAIAQHTLSKGEIIVPVPLLHVSDKRVLNMTDSDGHFTDWQQLLVNYCFSHDESSLMLCPTTNAILINHCSERMKNCPTFDGKPNAAYQWAGENWDPRTQIWLNKTIDELAQQQERLLALEIVATQDIQPGDEVFMDYGPEWEAAWRHHMQHWKSPPIISDTEKTDNDDSIPSAAKDSAYFSVSEANRNDTVPLPQLVSNSIREEKDHPHIFTACLYWPTKLDHDPVFHNTQGVDFDAMDDIELVNRYGDNGSFYRGDYSQQGDGSYWPCSVLFQENNTHSEEGDGEIQYLVRISQHHLHNSQPWDENELPRFLYHYPRASIRYFVKPYESDVFLKDAFRHPIHVPSKLWPEQWRNL